MQLQNACLLQPEECKFVRTWHVRRNVMQTYFETVSQKHNFCKGPRQFYLGFVINKTVLRHVHMNCFVWC